MARFYQRHFRVRGYEVGGSGCVHDSVFLNYVQQAAFEASADAGYDTRRYDAMGSVWVIRRQSIVYLAPLYYDDRIALKTWVSDFRRVRSHREYEMRRLPDGRLIALAQADWVYIDAASLQPRRIPPEMVDAFQPNGISALALAPAPEPSQTVEGTCFVYRHAVKGYELDNLRHVNNANYLNWLNETRCDALAQAGCAPGTGDAQFEGAHLTLAPVRYEIEYFLPAVAGDLVELHSQVVAAAETQLTWVHHIRRAGERLVEARATICFTGDDGRALPVPPSMLEALVRQS